MIEIKGTRSPQKDADPAQKYVLKSQDAKSRSPYAIGIMLTAFVLYLKSMFPDTATRAFVEDEAAPQIPQEPELALTGEEAVLPEETVSDDGGGAGAGGAAGGAPLATPAAPAQSFRFSAPNVISLFADRGQDAVRTPPKGSVPDNGVEGWTPGAETLPEETVQILVPGNTEPAEEEQDPPPAAGDDDEAVVPPRANRAPTVARLVYLSDVIGCAAVLIALSDFLAHADDADGDRLSVQNVTVSSGTIAAVDGGYLYTPDPDVPGPVQVRYQVTDGSLGVDQRAEFSVVAHQVEGSDGDDRLLGTLCADEIDGRAGDDLIDGRGGNDHIAGGEGQDHIVGGDGDDRLYGGAGDDIIFGGAGRDHIFGGAGDDRLHGDAGDDILFGEGGDDDMQGGAGADILFGGDGADRLFGGDGDDVLGDGAGDDAVYGGAGDDVIVAAMDASDDACDDIYDGGAGHDTLDYSAAQHALTIDLASGHAMGVEIGEDTISGFETVKGGSGDDCFIAGPNDARFTGGAGDNTFRFDAMHDDTHGSAEGSAEGGTGEALRAYQITDFDAGDVVRTSKYKIFDAPDEASAALFNAVYNETAQAGQSGAREQIRYRYERGDDGDDSDANDMSSGHTIVEYDHDDVSMATIITLNGHHILVWSDIG
ncbi:calcium-binding protein [Pseudogemmobacter sp. W21_MBD1_M6]|uniref:calcium-binding protein n=1 Tax=Pseudogemmobacter sp. W21_MBD1_M6 TaxID=3240271 RepID=UPI003F973B8C